MDYYLSTEDQDYPIATRKLEAYNLPLIMAMVALVGIGLISIYSATYQTPMITYFHKQLFFALLGMGAFLVAMFVPLHWVRSGAPLMYILAILLLIVVLVPGIGVKIHGQQCWISLGGFQFQPSELAKLATLIMVGWFIAYRQGFLHGAIDWIKLFMIVVVPMVLVLLEKDAGTASVFAALMVGVLLWVGVPIVVVISLVLIPISAITAIHAVMYQTFIGMIPLVVVATVIGYISQRRWWAPLITLGVVGIASYMSVWAFDHLAEYQRARIRTFFEPEKYPREEGYHVLQSLIAIGSGGITGKGYLQGTQTQLRYIPEQWTDFIFCVPAEEFGIVGAITVLGLYGFVLLRLEQLYRFAREPIASMLTFGFAVVILYHMLVNIGMTLGLVPVMGIPLPFMSSGGTALLVNMTAIGLIVNFYRRARLAQHLQ